MPLVQATPPKAQVPHAPRLPLVGTIRFTTFPRGANVLLGFYLNRPDAVLERTSGGEGYEAYYMFY